MTRLLTGQCHLLGLVDSSRCYRCKQASETATHFFFFCDCEALVVLRFRHLACHFLKPDEFASISISKVLQFVESEGLLNVYAKDCTKSRKRPRWKVYCCAHLTYSSLLYSDSTVLYCTLLSSPLLSSPLLSSSLLYSILLFTTLLNSSLLCSALHKFTVVY